MADFVRSPCKRFLRSVLRGLPLTFCPTPHPLPHPAGVGGYRRPGVDIIVDIGLDLFAKRAAASMCGISSQQHTHMQHSASEGSPCAVRTARDAVEPKASQRGWMHSNLPAPFTIPLYVL